MVFLQPSVIINDIDSDNGNHTISRGTVQYSVIINDIDSDNGNHQYTTSTPPGINDGADTVL